MSTLACTLTFETKVRQRLVGADMSEAGKWAFFPGEALTQEDWHAPVLPELQIRGAAINGLDSSLPFREGAKWRDMLARRPRTDLGRKLWEIRERIIASGAPLRTWDEISAEVAERRGEARPANGKSDVH